MANTNAKIAELLRRYAAVLRLEGVDRFKIKAYQRAADTLESTPQDVSRIIARGESLESLPGIGKAISAKIQEIVSTGKLPQLDKAVSKLSPELIELADKPLLDPARVRRAYKKLKVSNLKELKEKLDSGEAAKLLDRRTEFHLRRGFDERPRVLLWSANDFAGRFVDFLRKLPGVLRAEPTGSLRRKQDTIGDFNFLAAGKSSQAVFRSVLKFPGILSHRIISQNEISLRLSSGRTVTVRFTPAGEWGLNDILSTGSSAHIEKLRERFSAGRKSFTSKSLGKAAESEEAVYHRAGLPFIEPELREGAGEIAAAASGKLPRLVTVKDLRGDLHMHTTASDGANTLLEMATAAKKRGYEYIAITDHSQSLRLTNGLSPKRLAAQMKAIDKLNARLKGITILKSSEVDILEDGSLDFPNSILRELDLTICSIHSRFGLGKKEQTERLMRAMDNRYFNILGHATGRLLLKREGYEIDLPRLLKHAARCGCFFEINSSPDRLDLSDENARLAKKAGLKLAVNTDAHSTEELEFISAGINQARRGWLEQKDVLNAYPLEALLKLLRR